MKGNAARKPSARKDEERLSGKEKAAIRGLLVNPSIPDAAKKAGINETILWYWLQCDTFPKEYRRAQRAFEADSQGIPRPGFDLFEWH